MRFMAARSSSSAIMLLRTGAGAIEEPDRFFQRLQ
jgi:hypothetical protein